MSTAAVDCKRSVEIEIPIEEVERAKERVTNSIKQRVRLPGFRPGKAPLNIIQSRFEGEIRNEVLELLLPQAFRERVQAAIAAAPDGWIIDGSYAAKLGDLVLEQADTLVWLDLPLRVCLRRLWRRTWGRIIRHEELWSGNRESIRTAFLIKDSLFAWTISSTFSNKGQGYWRDGQGGCAG